MATKVWNAASGDWFATSSLWLDENTFRSTSAPVSGDTVYIEASGTVTISAADALANPLIDGLTVHFSYLGSGALPVMDVTNTSFGGSFSIDNFFSDSPGDLIARGIVSLDGTLSGDVPQGPAFTLDIESSGGSALLRNSGTVQADNGGILVVTGAASATLVSTGLVTANNATAEIGTALTIDASGTLSAVSFGTLELSGAVFNAGTLLASSLSGGFYTDGVALFSGALDNTGTVAVTLFGTLRAAAGVLNSGTISNSGGMLEISGGLQNNGLVRPTGGTTTIGGSVTGTGTIVVADTADIELTGSVAATQTISFAGGLGDLKIDDAADFHGTVTGLAGHDVIDLVGVTATTAVTSNGTLGVFAGTAEIASFAVSGAATLFADWDGASGTVLSLEPAGTPAQVEHNIIAGASGTPLPNWVETIGSDPTVTYGFDASSNWTASQKQAFIDGLNFYQDIAKVHFVEVSNGATANIDFVRASDGQAFEETIGHHATISIDTSVGSWSNLFDIGTADMTGFGGYGFSTVLHEEGHAMGLSHPGNYNEVADIQTQQSYYTDTHQYSVMSYFSDNYSGANTTVGVNQIYDQSPMLYDIGALQQIYGANTTTLSGNDVFGFNSTFGTGAAHPLRSYDFTQNPLPVVTLYDGGGNNTLDLSGFSTPSYVNLDPGEFSDLAGLTDNIAIAYSTHIDTAIGGLGNDSFIVNADSDRIDGGGGTNTVIFPGDLAQYTLTRQGGTESVSAFGITDTLSNITTLQFADQSVAADSIACFAGGTRIATLHGDVAVEALQLGMQVLTATGAPAPIVWVGYRHINCRRHPRPHDVQPIRVQAHAFGPGRPERDLWLSPDHAVRVDRVLIPIRYLANGATVRQEAVDSVTYYHVELPTHGLVLAEGLAAESYLDTGNRDAFTNGGGAVRLQADLARRVWDARSCCQLRVDGPDVMVARRTLLARAAMLGHATTDESHLAVMAGGVRCQPTVTGRQWLVRLPPGTRTVRLQSRSWVPGERRAESRDFRQLGVAIGDARLDGIELPPLDERFADGWHAAEAGWRWTDGDAGITVAGHCVLAFNIVSTGQYWVAMDGVPGFGGSSYQVGRTFHG